MGEGFQTVRLVGPAQQDPMAAAMDTEESRCEIKASLRLVENSAKARRPSPTIEPNNNYPQALRNHEP